MNIQEAFNILMVFEGGSTYTNTSGDLGGGTRWGISRAAYPNLDIENLTEAQALTIYTTDYWNNTGCPNIIPELQYVVFDTAVNMGVGTAEKLLSEMQGNTTIERYLLLREVYDTQIVEHRQKQIKFLGGWSNRNLSILKLHDDHEI